MYPHPWVGGPFGKKNCLGPGSKLTHRGKSIAWLDAEGAQDDCDRVNEEARKLEWEGPMFEVSGCGIGWFVYSGTFLGCNTLPLLHHEWGHMVVM